MLLPSSDRYTNIDLYSNMWSDWQYCVKRLSCYTVPVVYYTPMLVVHMQGRRNHSGQSGHGRTNIFGENGHGQRKVGVGRTRFLGITAQSLCLYCRNGYLTEAPAYQLGLVPRVSSHAREKEPKYGAHAHTCPWNYECDHTQPQPRVGVVFMAWPVKFCLLTPLICTGLIRRHGVGSTEYSSVTAYRLIPCVYTALASWIQR